MSLDDLRTRNISDPTAVRWEGVATQGDTAFSCTLISQIEGNLWMGGCIDGLRLPDDFEYVVSLYPWEEYVPPEKCTRVSIWMYDSEDVPNDGAIWGLASLVVTFVEHGKTLVHCQAGLNRSGLVAAAALIKMGRTPEEAIALLHEKRTPAVLCNPHFREWVLAQ